MFKQIPTLLLEETYRTRNRNERGYVFNIEKRGFTSGTHKKSYSFLEAVIDVLNVK